MPLKLLSKRVLLFKERHHRKKPIAKYKVHRKCEKGNQQEDNFPLDAETIESPALSLEGVDNIERCDSLSLGVLGVSD
jgi:hypothetical protein